ncbi:MAG: DUF4342 domain-containing protein [Chloroflexota bacterium]|nr:DUF4342 domain-containing protein [Chloroflexota bacterium]
MSTQKLPEREEIRIDTENLITKFKELVNEGNVHRISLRTDEGKTLFEVPLTMGVAGAAAALFLAPTLAALGVIAALTKQVTLVVERTEA